MVLLSLKIRLPEADSTKTIQLNPNLLVYDACKVIRDKFLEASGHLGKASDYGLFLNDEDTRKGRWLDPNRTLEFYLLRNGDSLEYKRKIRSLKVRMLDNSIKTIMVDESQTLKNLLPVICSKIGLTNYDEYDLVREYRDDEKENARRPSEAGGTLTMSSSGSGTLSRRSGTLSRDRDQKKMEKLMDKLATDDNVHWVDQSRTLIQQGVEESDILLLKRRYFYSDQNVDARDPVQLNLLYVQCRDAILSGTHPVTVEQAYQFAGMQAQVEYGDFDESRRNIDMRPFLPKTYLKSGTAERRVYDEWHNQRGMGDLQAKVAYIKLARSLKTYGVTFFLVREKLPGKNKMVPRLFGVTRNSVLGLDERTKETLTTWPLTQVKRWAASPNTFTLDFGDYADSYFSVETKEGEQIAQLIAGYIDIILKRQKPKDHFGVGGEEGCTLEEDEVLPARIQVIQPREVPAPVEIDRGKVAVPGIIRDINQKRPIEAIETVKVKVVKIQEKIEEPVVLPPIGEDPVSKKWVEQKLEVHKQNIGTQMAQVTKHVAQIVNLTSPPVQERDYVAIDKAMNVIATSLDEMVDSVKFVAAVVEDGKTGDDLYDATQRLIRAVRDLLDAAQPGEAPRQEVLTQATKVADASKEIMERVDPLSAEFQDALVVLAKGVATATATLVRRAKVVAAATEDAELQNRIIQAATQTALSTSELVACAKVLLPTITSPECQDQLVEAARKVARSVQELLEACKISGVEKPMLEDLNEAAAKVTQALNELLGYVKQGPDVSQAPMPHEAAVEVIQTSTQHLCEAPEPAEMIRQAKVLAQATAELVKGLKSEAEGVTDKDLQRRLLAASKQLADATTRLVEAAKLCAAQPQDGGRRQDMRDAAINIRDLAQQATIEDEKSFQVRRLESYAKRVASTSTQTIAAAQAAESFNLNRGAQQNLMDQARVVADRLTSLISAVKSTSVQTSPEPAAVANLVHASEDILSPGEELVSSAKAAVPTVQEPAAAGRLRESAGNLQTALSDLRTGLHKARQVHTVTTETTTETSLTIIRSVERDLEAFKKAAQTGSLVPLPDENIGSAGSRLQTSAKQVSNATVQLLNASTQADEAFVADASQNVARSLQDLSVAARGVAASMPDDRQGQMRMLDAAKEVAERGEYLVESVREALARPGEHAQSRLVDAAREVAAALNRCLNCLPDQRDIQRAIKTVEETTQRLVSTELIVRPSRHLVADVFIDLNNAGTRLNEAAGEVVSGTYGTQEHLNSSAEHYTTAYKQFVDNGLQIVSSESETQRREEIIRNLLEVSSASTRLLQLARQTHGQDNAPQMRNSLTAAARAVTESINNLLTFCAGSMPGQKECDNAIRRIQQLRSMLDNCNVPANQKTYYESLDTVLDSSRVLGEGMAGISQTSKHGQQDQFVQAVRQTTDAVSQLIENASQAAYLIGLSDPNSLVGRQGIIDQREVQEAVRGIQDASRNILQPGHITQQQMLGAATIIAKYSHTLCSCCRTASSRSSDPVAKRQFVQSAKDIATHTANLVRAVKQLDGDLSDANRHECSQHVHSLLKSVNELGAYSSSPEFAGSAGQLSTSGRKLQEPIIVSGKCIVDATSSLILAAKTLSVNPREPSAWQALTSQSTNVSDSVKSLAASIRDHAPGQVECSEALERIKHLLKITNRAALNATQQSLPSRQDNSTEGFFELSINTTHQIIQTIGSVRDAARSEAEALGHRVQQLAQQLQSLVQDGIGAASRSPNSRDQMTILNQIKTVLESSLQFIEISRACGGNPRSRNLHGDLQDAHGSLQETLRELLQSLERVQSEAGFVKTILSNLSTSISRVEQRISGPEESLADYQTRIFRLTKEMLRLTHELNAKSVTEPQELGPLAQQLAQQYERLVEDARGAQGACDSEEVGRRLAGAVQDLGQACIEVVKMAGAVQSSPEDSYVRDELSRSCKLLIERVSQVLSALQAGSRGTQACISAASTVSGVIGDLDTTIMFATAGILQPENDQDRFSDHREDILKTAKALVEDTKTLVTGAASSQEQLAVAAQNAVKTIVQLAEVVKSGAASLGKDNSESQVLLINAVRDVASALGDLIQATKAASGKSLNDPAMLYLKDSAKIMVTNVTSLLKTVKTVEDEHARGTRALEATIEAVGQEIRMFDSSDPNADGRTATAEDLLRITKPLTQATYKAVTAGKTGRQEDAIIAANMGRKAVADLLLVSRAAAASCESSDTRNRVLSAGRDCAVKYREVLQTVYALLTKTGPDNARLRDQLVQLTQNVAGAVSVLCAAAESMKDPETWMNPEDPTVIAENELLGAAATIEHAAKKLSQLQPRRIEYKIENETLNFDELILEACMQITAATATLIKSTSVAQGELVAAGLVSARPLYSSEDGQWSDGLISAARTVAAACHNLCEAAQALVQGHATEEKLISSAKQVASSTAQLLVACRVKSDANSPSMQRLQAAGNAVMRATDNLVRAAQQSLDAYEERSLVINRRIVGGIAQEISAQEEVLIKERELEEARGKLLALRKAKYGERQSDDEYYGYGSSTHTSTHGGHTTTETRITEARFTSGYTSQ